MATLTVQQISTAGVVPADLVAADTDGDSFANNGRTFLDIANGGDDPITVTVAAVRPCDQGFTHDITNTIADGATERMGPFDPNRYSDAAGAADVTYSDVTSVTVGAFSI